MINIPAAWLFGVRKCRYDSRSFAGAIPIGAARAESMFPPKKAEDVMDTTTLDTASVSSLALTAVEAIPISIPLTKPMRMGNSTLSDAAGTIVRLEAEDGTVGE